MNFGILGVMEFLDDLRNFLLLEISSVTTLQFRKISAGLLLFPFGDTFSVERLTSSSSGSHT